MTHELLVLPVKERWWRGESLLLVPCHQFGHGSQMLCYHCRKVANYYKQFLVIVILLIRATNWAPTISQELTLVLGINYISPLVHTNPYFQDGEDKAQGKTVGLGQSQDASPGLPVTASFHHTGLLLF